MARPKSLRERIPDAASVVAMHPSELGGHVLEVLRGLGDDSSGDRHRGNFCMHASNDYSRNVREDGPHQGVLQACAEAWSWLESNHLVSAQPGSQEGWFFVTRKGEEVADAAGVRTLVNSEQLPASFLHPDFVRDVRSHFVVGRYDTAVFEAFRLLEISIRSRARLGNEYVGVKLANRAFHPETGELTDPSAEGGERVALMNLIAGAIGSYKNPQSHRHVGVDAEEAREMILIASHLRKIVDSRPQVP